MLLNREPAAATASADSPNGEYVLNLRHYAITTKATGLSRGIRRLNAAEKLLKSRERKKSSVLPNLGKLEDVADYLLDPSAAAGFTSASESEADTDAEVEVLETAAKKVLSKSRLSRVRAGDGDNPGSGGVERRAVKLVELGPRLKLRLAKVEEGVCSGKVMWHERETKSPAEAKRLDALWRERREQREKRREEQRENVARKRAAQGKGKKQLAAVDGRAEHEWDSEDDLVMGDADAEEDVEDDEGMLQHVPAG